MKILPIALFLIVLLSGCQSETEPDRVYTADFSQLQAVKENVATNVGVFGGSGKRKIPPVKAERLGYHFQADALELTFDSAGYFKVIPAALGFPAAWPDVHTIELDIDTESATELLFELYGLRSRLQDTLNLEKGQHTSRIDLREIPLLGGLESEITQLNFQFSDQGSVRLQQIRLHRSSVSNVLVDQWGQRKLADFPGKVSREQQLVTPPDEQRFLDSLQFPFSIDAYGGFTEHQLELEANGFFRTQQIGDRWFLVTPAGNPFYSFGLNGVRRKSTLNNAALTRIKDREHLFERLPDYEDCPECFSPDSNYLSFYCHNVKTKYPNYEAWKAATTERIRTLGFNTIGNWSDSLFYGGKFPYTYTLDSRVFTGLLASENLPDVFHPDWEHRLDSAFAEIARFAEDEFLLGYFVDNEMPWGRIGRLDNDSYTSRALSTYSSLAEKQAKFAERYFSTVKKAIRKHDPNHLYLGCRFTRKLESHRTIAEVAGKYLDVLSVNVYSPFTRSEMDGWYEVVQKPILIGEHHIPPQTQRALLPRYPAFSLARRDELVRDYLQRWVSYPYAVGSHWYQFVDQEVAGRGDGGENQPVGLIRVTDQLDQRLALVFFDFAKTIPGAYLKTKVMERPR